MNIESGATPMSGEPPAVSPPTPSLSHPTRPLYWSVRRELWENRSIVIVPLIAAAVVLFGFLIGAAHVADRMDAIAKLDRVMRSAVLVERYGVATMPIVFAMVLVGVFYCLDALHGERRDRSILFWKSLPLSDRTAVLAKAGIPLVVLPAFTFAVILVTQLIIVLLGTAILLAKGSGAATLWANLPLLQMSVAMLYGLVVMTLWHAPIYGWLLLVSGWAKRNVFLWAVLPPLALSIVEKIAFGTTHLASLLKYRMTGWLDAAFDFASPGRDATAGPLAELTPLDFLSTPGLWIGLVVAAALLIAAIRMRRSQDPI